jgi:short-subunit dehydrogenase
MSSKLSRTILFGATSAIAQQTARLLARQGSHLFLVARNRDKVEAVAADLRVHGAPLVAFAVSDLNDCSNHVDLIRLAFEALGGLDCALIMHGVLGDQTKAQGSYRAAAEVFRTNALSTISLLTELGNLFEKQRAGHIAVVSSVAGDRGRASNYVYGASKAAVDVFVEGLRSRLVRSNVSVLTVKPGFVDTPMTAHLKKNALFAQPSTIAQGIVRSLETRRDVVYLPWFWRWIMLIIRCIPGPLFKRLKL